ncbi:MAG: hypothetical protein ACOCYE_08115, partial [Pseudomonadota bacterium]
MRRVIVAACVAWVSSLHPAAAKTVVLTFDGLASPSDGPIKNADRIPQHYGDVPGVVDVRYGAVETLQSVVRRADDFLRYWDSGYGGLVDVAYCCGIGLGGAAEIALVPRPGQWVTLHGMDFADYRRSSDPWQVAVFAIDDLAFFLEVGGPVV